MQKIVQIVIILIIVLVFTVFIYTLINKIIQKQKQEHLNGGADALCSTVNIFPYMIAHPNTNTNFINMWMTILKYNRKLRNIVEEVNYSIAKGYTPNQNKIKAINDCINSLTLPKIAKLSRQYSKYDDKDKIKIRDEDVILLMILAKLINKSYKLISLPRYITLRAYFERTYNPMIANFRHDVDKYLDNIIPEAKSVDLYYIESNNKNIITEQNLEKTENRLKCFYNAYDCHTKQRGREANDNIVNIHFMYDIDNINNMYYIDILRILFDKNVKFVTELYIYDDIIERENSYDSDYSTGGANNINYIKINNTQSEIDFAIEKRGKTISYYKCKDGDGMFFTDCNDTEYGYMSVGIDKKYMVEYTLK